MYSIPVGPEYAERVGVLALPSCALRARLLEGFAFPRRKSLAVG